MTPEEAIDVLQEKISPCVTGKRKEAVDMAISALQAQDSETRKICDTCKHDPPSKKWPCADCDMRNPADRWEPKGEQVAKILADILDGCPLVDPCNKIWALEGWCKDHCKPGQQEPDSECWLKYAEIMVEETENSNKSSLTQNTLDVPEINVGGTVSRQAAIDAAMEYGKKVPTYAIRVKNAIEQLPSAQPNNQVNLCDSCKYLYPDCPSEADDVIFGNGKGNDNICACNKYLPSAHPERTESEDKE